MSTTQQETTNSSRHIAINAHGQDGKVLKYRDYIIRIGRHSPADALLNVLRVVQFVNESYPVLIKMPNMVIHLCFTEGIDRKALSHEPKAVFNPKFPGVPINLDNDQYNITPLIHTNEVSHAILPGCTRPEGDVIAEVNDLARQYSVKRRRIDSGETISA